MGNRHVHYFGIFVISIIFISVGTVAVAVAVVIIAEALILEENGILTITFRQCGSSGGH